MLVVRPAGPGDYDALMTLARESGPGFTSLPEDEPTLRKRLDVAEASFNGTHDRQDCWYTMMMEDTDTGEVVGLAGVKAAVGLKRPFASFRRVTFSHFHVSDSLTERVDQPALLWVNECRGWSEVGSLFLKPERRIDGAGSLLARSRYLLIASEPKRFSEWVLAELRGVFDEHNRSPFWEHVTSKFFPLTFERADELSGSTDGQFIFDLCPHHPLYENLLHPEARAVIGQVFHEGVPAKMLLEKEGFREIGLVDVFDAGPTVACHRDAIRTVKDSRAMPVSIKADPQGGKALVSANSIERFRATRATVEVVADHAYISAETAAALKVRNGDFVRVMV